MKKVVLGMICLIGLISCVKDDAIEDHVMKMEEVETVVKERPSLASFNAEPRGIAITLLSIEEQNKLSTSK